MTGTLENHAGDAAEANDAAGLTMADAILVRALADGDACWLPQRRHATPVSAATLHARREFVLHGVPWRSESRSEAEAKQAERALKSLVSDGFAKVHVAGVAKTTSIALTDSGETYARRYCGLPDDAAAWSVAQMLAERTKRDLRPWPGASGYTAPPSKLEDAWLCERELMDPARPFGEEAAIVENMALPYLRRRLIVALSDVEGRVLYALSPAGWSLLDDPTTEPPEVDYEGDRTARGIYDARLTETRAKLTHTAPPGPAARDLGSIPLPVAYRGYELTLCYLPARVVDFTGGPYPRPTKTKKRRRRRAAGDRDRQPGRA